jgi:hypothetical protein
MPNFSEEKINKVWEKAQIVENYDPTKYRQDVCNAWIQRDQYGTENSFGWEVDHVFPQSKGGTDDLLNLRPMHWENNRSKADDFPQYSGVLTSKDNTNIREEKSYTVNEKLIAELKIKYNLR